MPIQILCLLVVAIFVIAVALLSDHQYLIGIVFSFLMTIMISWIIIAALSTPAILETKTYPIEYVKMDDGSFIQSIQIDQFTKLPLSHDLTAIYPEGTLVKRHHISSWTCGILWKSGPEDEKYTIEVVGKNKN